MRNNHQNLISFEGFTKNELLQEEFLGGKIKNIKKMEELFDSISKVDALEEYNLQIAKNDYSLSKANATKSAKLNTKYVDLSKINQIASKLEDLICKEFNFADVAIEWNNPDMIGMGPCTMPVYPSYFDLLMGNYDYKIVKTSEGGYKWASSRGKYAWISINLIGFTNVTSKECMALLLHEIGHSFNNYRTTWQKIYKTSLTPMLACYKFFYFFRSKITKKASELSILKNLSQIKTTILDRYIAFLADSQKIGMSVLTILNPAIILINAIQRFFRTYCNVGNLLTFGMHYEHELQSDNFAMIYGYAYPLASCMKKFRNFSSGKSIINGNYSPFIHFMNKICNFTGLLIALYDVHPNMYQRMLNSKNYIEGEMKNTKNAKAKRFLKEQRDGIEKVIKAYHEQNEFKPFAKAANYIDKFKETIFFVDRSKENSFMKQGYSDK